MSTLDKMKGVLLAFWCCSVAVAGGVGDIYERYRESPWSNEPLIQAACRDDAQGLERLQRLLQEGADVQVCSESGYTALMAAAYAGNVDAVRFLLPAGADCRARTKQGSTVLHSLARADLQYCTACRGMTAGDVDAALQKLDERLVLIADMLMKAGVEVDAVNAEGKTPIALAMLRHPRLVKKLLDSGANPNGRVGAGEGTMTLLMAAAYLRKPEVAAALLAAGADVNAVERDGGNTALHYAVKSGRRIGEGDDSARNEVVRLLRAAGANPRLKDAAGWSVMQIAEGRADAELVSLLVSAAENGNKTGS